MNQSNAQPALFQRFVYGTVLLSVPVLALFFLGIGSSPFSENGVLDAAAFAPLKQPQQAQSVKPATADEVVPEVRLTVWEYTGLRISSPR